MGGYAIENDFRLGCLRALRLDDADGMLEWMHTREVAGVFEQDFLSMTREEVERFIEGSYQTSHSLHFAIAGEDDRYLGTISLKDIDSKKGTAEYAIAMRKCAHGTGIALYATRHILEYAFGNLGLRCVYLYVRRTNLRAIAFYNKVGFIGDNSLALKHPDVPAGVLWFAMNHMDWAKVLASQ